MSVLVGFQVFFSKQVLKFASRVDSGYSRQIELLKKVLQVEPVPAALYHVKKLGAFESTYRIRIGKIRLLYEIDWKEHSVWVYEAGFRESAYD